MSITSNRLQQVFIPRCHDLSKRTETDQNGPKRTKTDRNGPTKIPKRTSRSTETGLNKGKVEQGTAGQIPTLYLPTWYKGIVIPA